MTVAATIAVLAIIGLAVHRLHRGGGVTRLLALLGLFLLADRAALAASQAKVGAA